MLRVILGLLITSLSVQAMNSGRQIQRLPGSTPASQPSTDGIQRLSSGTSVSQPQAGGIQRLTPESLCSATPSKWKSGFVIPLSAVQRQAAREACMVRELEPVGAFLAKAGIVKAVAGASFPSQAVKSLESNPYFRDKLNPEQKKTTATLLGLAWYKCGGGTK